MAHFTELDENNKVIQVIVVNNNELLDENGNESEQKGIDFCVNLFGGNWIQTSYNGNFRQRYAGIGSVFITDANLFTEPQPYPSWSLDTNYKWQPPVSKPTDGKNYYWDEAILNWIEVPTE
jgi:hypothetical protein